MPCEGTCFFLRFFSSLEVADTTHGRNQSIDVFRGNDLLPFIELRKKDLRDAALNVGKDLAAVFKGGEIPVDGIKVSFQVVVTVLLDVKYYSADVDADILFHKSVVTLW